MTVGHSLLLVEDGPLLAQTLADFLTGERFRVRTAATFDEALSNLQEARFDAVVTDVFVPGSIDVAAFLRRMRAHTPNRQTPVVYMTAWPGLVLERRDILLVKPFCLNDLLRALARCIRAPGLTRVEGLPARFSEIQPQQT